MSESTTIVGKVDQGTLYNLNQFDTNVKQMADNGKL
jgi:hypothetical protein